VVQCCSFAPPGKGGEQEVTMKRMRSLNWILPFVAALVWTLPVQAKHTVETGDKTAEKTFRVEEANIKLGKVAAGKDAVGTFVFHNDTDHDVKIIRAKPS